MAQYFELPVKIKAGDDPVDVITAQWSDVDPMLAIATRNKKLWVVQEEVRPPSRCRGCPRRVIPLRPALLIRAPHFATRTRASAT
jgi:hypothetical protein